MPQGSGWHLNSAAKADVSAMTVGDRVPEVAEVAMLSDCSVMMLAGALIALATLLMTALAVLFMQWMLEIGELFHRVRVTRAERFVVNEAATLTPSRELAGD